MKAEHSFDDQVSFEIRSPLLAWLKRRRWLIIFVWLPTIIAALYFGVIASDVYVSESRFVIKSPDQKRPQLSTLANLIQTTGLSSGQEQTNEILEYIRSRDALESLDKRMGLRSRYGASEVDRVSRFPQPWMSNTFEDLFRYYSKRVSAQLDKETGTAVLKVEAFTPQDAYLINRQLLELSEGLVNRLNERAEGRAIVEAQKQVELATVRAKKARLAMARYRNAQSIIDPAKQATGALEVSNRLIAERAALQAQLETMMRETPRNPSIPALRSRVAAVSAQIGTQDLRVAGSSDGIASKLSDYENLLVEQEFATQSLTAANAALVQARSESQRQKFYLERIVDAGQPDMPLLPRRLLSVLVVAACSLCLYLIGWMLIVGIIEHAPEG